MKRKILQCLPLWLVADRRYLVIEGDLGENQSVAVEPEELSGLEFMFFSNADGKLLLSNTENFKRGSGLLYKTTARPAYQAIMQREYETIRDISKLSKSNILPKVYPPLSVHERTIYREEYVSGQTLRTVFHSPSVTHNAIAFRDYIEQLDDWFKAYLSTFSGASKSLSELYAPVFSAFSVANQNDRDLLLIGRKLEQRLNQVSHSHAGMVPIVAHNDLWPGNFLVSRDGLIAVDWERATPDRAELYDYFWLIISAGLEILGGQTKALDYAFLFRKLITDDCSVGRCVKEKLLDKLQQKQLDSAEYLTFLSLFLLEFSIQGWTVLGEKTDMDKLAANELKNLVSDKDVFL